VLLACLITHLCHVFPSLTLNLCFHLHTIKNQQALAAPPPPVAPPLEHHQGSAGSDAAEEWPHQTPTSPPAAVELLDLYLQQQFVEQLTPSSSPSSPSAAASEAASSALAAAPEATEASAAAFGTALEAASIPPSEAAAATAVVAESEAAVPPAETMAAAAEEEQQQQQWDEEEEEVEVQGTVCDDDDNYEQSIHSSQEPDLKEQLSAWLQEVEESFIDEQGLTGQRSARSYNSDGWDGVARRTPSSCGERDSGGAGATVEQRLPLVWSGRGHGHEEEEEEEEEGGVEQLPLSPLSPLQPPQQQRLVDWQQPPPTTPFLATAAAASPPACEQATSPQLEPPAADTSPALMPQEQAAGTAAAAAAAALGTAERAAARSWLEMSIQNWPSIALDASGCLDSLSLEDFFLHAAAAAAAATATASTAAAAPLAASNAAAAAATTSSNTQPSEEPQPIADATSLALDLREGARRARQLVASRRQSGVGAAADDEPPPAAVVVREGSTAEVPGTITATGVQQAAAAAALSGSATASYSSLCSPEPGAYEVAAARRSGSLIGSGVGSSPPGLFDTVPQRAALSPELGAAEGSEALPAAVQAVAGTGVAAGEEAEAAAVTAAAAARHGDWGCGHSAWRRGHGVEEGAATDGDDGDDGDGAAAEISSDEGSCRDDSVSPKHQRLCMDQTGGGLVGIRVGGGALSAPASPREGKRRSAMMTEWMVDQAARDSAHKQQQQQRRRQHATNSARPSAAAAAAVGVQVGGGDDADAVASVLASAIGSAGALQAQLEGALMAVDGMLVRYPLLEEQLWGIDEACCSGDDGGGGYD